MTNTTEVSRERIEELIEWISQLSSRSIDYDEEYRDDTIACLRELQRSMMSHINWRSIETDPPSRDTIKSDKLLVCDNFGNVCANHWSDYGGLHFWAEDTDDARGAILFWAEYPSPPAIESVCQSTPSPP